MPIFFERFCIPLCAGTIIVLGLTNPMHWDWPERIWGSILALVAAIVVSIIVHKHNQKKSDAARGPKLVATTDRAPIQHKPPVIADQVQPSAPVIQASTQLPDGKIIVGFGPKYLFDLVKHHTSVQASKLVEIYIGKWMRFSGDVGNVTLRREGMHVIVKVEDETGKKMDLTLLLLDFEKNWSERLEILGVGDRISGLGQINTVDSMSIYLGKCELDVPG
jgi:hypothetical protein